MATIDIRDNIPTVDIIRFWDNPTGNYLVTGLTYIDGEVKIEDLENIRSLKILRIKLGVFRHLTRRKRL